MFVTVISWNQDTGEPEELCIGQSDAAAKFAAAQIVVEAGDSTYEGKTIREAKAAIRARDPERAFAVFTLWVSTDVAVRSIKVWEDLPPK